MEKIFDSPNVDFDGETKKETLVEESTILSSTQENTWIRKLFNQGVEARGMLPPVNFFMFSKIHRHIPRSIGPKSQSSLQQDLLHLVLYKRQHLIVRLLL